MKAYRIERDVVRVTGPEAESFLQGQLSQDVAVLAAGASAWSLILQPQGKVDVFVRVTRTDDGGFLLDTDGGWGERVVERLSRFKLRTKAEIEQLDWRSVALRGDGPAPAAGPDTVVLPFSWGGLRGWDLLGAGVVPPPEVEEGDSAEYERLRIEAGIPRMGAELDERTIPAEAGVVAQAVSFTKGCYTGQELVARIDSRGGNVPRHLRRLEVHGAVPPPGAAIVSGGREVGTVTSAAATGTGAVALGYVGRALDVPAEVELQWDGGDASALVDALPAA